MPLRRLYGCIVLLCLISFSKGFGQTSVTAAAPLTLCVGGAPQTLGNITVSEVAGSPGGFQSPQTSATFILSAPSNFIFVSPGAVTVTPTGGGLAFNSVTVTSSEITITLTVTSAAAINTFVISNVQVTAVTAAASGNIMRLNGMTAGGSFNVSGGTAGRGLPTSYAALSSQGPPTTSAANLDQDQCNTSTFTLNGNNPVSGTGGWSFVGPGLGAVITNPALRTSTVTGVPAGNSVTLRWTISGGPCPASTDDVVLTNRAIVTSVAGPTQVHCGNPNFSLSGSDPSPGTGLWTISGPGTITAPTDRFSTVTGITAGNSSTLTWTVTNGACISPSNVTLTNNVLAPIASAGPDQDLCTTSTFTLAGNGAGSGTGGWTIIGPANGTIISTPSSPASTISGLNNGASVTLRWTITDACSSSSDDVVIMNRANSAPVSAGTNLTNCNSPNFFVTGSDPAPGTGLWTTASSAVIVSPNSRTTAVNNVTAGSVVTLTWTVTNGNCLTTPSSITLTNTASAPIAAAGPDQDLCTTSTFTLAANSATPATGGWTIIGPANGTIISTPSSPASTISGLNNGASVTLRWTITDACSSSSDDVVIMNRANSAPVSAGTNLTNCNSPNFFVTGSDPAPGTGLWTTASSAVIVSPNSRTTAVNNVTAGSVVTLTWTVTNGNCVTTPSSITLTNTASAPIAAAGPDQDLCTTSTFTLAANSATPATGGWTIIGPANGTIISTPSSPASTISGLNNGASVTLRWTITDACSSSSDDVVIMNRANSAPVSAGTNLTNCNSPNFFVTGSDPAPGTGLWTTASSAVIVSPNSRTTAVTNVTAGSVVTITWTVTNGNCVTTPSSITLTNAAPAPTAAAGGDVDQCMNSSFTLAGNAATPATGAWTIIGAANGAIITTPSSPTSTVTGLTNGSNVTLRWTISDACTTSNDDVVLINRAGAAGSVAGSNQMQCGNSIFYVTGSDPSPGTGVWTTASSAIIVSPNSRTTQVTNVAPGVGVLLTWTVNNGSCLPSSSSSSLTLTNNGTPPTSNAGPDQDQCGTTSFNLAGNDPTPGTGVWAFVGPSNGASITSPGAANSTVTNLLVGKTVTLRWTVGNGICANTSDDVVLINRDFTITSNAGGPTQSQCNTSTFSLNGNDPSPATGLWTISGPGTITSPTNRFSTVTGITAGSSAVLTWTINNGSCGTSGSSVTLTNYATPTTAAAGPDQDLCVTSSFMLNANSPLIGTGFWTVTGSGTFVDPTNPGTTLNGVTGTSTAHWTITTGGSCAASADDVILTNRPLVTTAANAGTNQTQCNNSIFYVSGSDPSPGIGTWTTASSAIIVSPNSRTTQVTNVAAGAGVVLTWTVTNGNCGPLSSSVTLTNNGAPATANAGPDQDRCGGSSTFTLAGNSEAPGTGLWTFVGANGGASITTPGSPSSTVTGVPVNTPITLRWTTGNGVCASTSDDVVLLLRSLAITDAGTAQNQCNNSTFSLNGSDPTPGSGVWTISGPGTITSPSNRFSTVTGITAGSSSTLTWTVNNGSCGTTGASVLLTNYIAPPTANAGIDQSVCAASIPLAGNAPAPGTGKWTILSGTGGSFVLDTDPLTTFNGSAGIVYNLRWTITSGPCSTYDDVQIQLNQTPNAAAAAQAICSGQTTNVLITNPNGVAGTTYTWTVFSTSFVSGASGGSGASINQVLTTTNATAGGSVTYRVKPTAGICSGATTDVTVTVNPVPTTVATPLTVSLCSGQSTSIALTNSPAVAGGVAFNWTVATVGPGSPTGQTNGSGTSISQALSSPDNFTDNIRYTVIATSTAGTCAGPATTVDVQIKPTPSVQISAGNTTTICSGGTTVINLNNNPSAVPGTSFTWTSLVTAGTVGGHSGGSGSSIAQILTTNNGGGTVMYTITPSANGCPGAPVTTSVVVYPVPAGATTNETAICSGIPFSYNPQTGISNGVTGNTFIWTSSFPTGLTLVTGTPSGSGLITGTLKNQTGGVLNATYTVTPTAPAPGGCTGNAFTIVVPVNPEPVGALITEPAVCSNVAFSFSPQVQITNGVTSTFTWSALYDAGLSGGVAGGSGNVTGTIANTTNTPILYASFTVTPTSGSGCAGVPFVIKVPISPKPQGTNAIAPAICSDASVNYNLQTNVNAANGVASNFKWVVLTPTAGVSGQSVTQVSGPFINDILGNISGGNKVVTYTVTPTSLSGCDGNTFTVDVTVKSKPTALNSVKAVTCSGLPFSYDPQLNVNTGNGMTSTFVWSAFYQPGISGGAGAGTGNVADALSNFSTAQLNAVYTITPTATSSGCTGGTFTITVPVNPAPVGVAQTVSRCSNAALAVTLGTTGGSVAAASYNITVSAPGTISQTAGPSAGSGKSSSELMDDVWKNTTSNPVNVTYTIVPISASSCLGNPFTVILTVNPEPVGVADNVSRCSDINVNYNLVNNVALMGNNVGSSFSWKASSTGGALGASVSPKAGPVINDVLVNDSGSDETVVYDVTPTSASLCQAGNIFQITVLVHSKPKGTSVPAAAGTVICSGSVIGDNLQANVTSTNGINSTFTWSAPFNPNVSGVSTTLQTSSIISDVLINTSGMPRVVTYTVTPTGTVNGCVGNSFTVAVTVNPRAVISAGPDLGVCKNVTSLVIQGHVTFAPQGYTWSSSGGGTFSPSASGVEMPTFTHPTSTVTLTFTATDPDFGGPCLAETDQMIVKVNPLPNPSFKGLPSSAAENDPVINLDANKGHGTFTITPGFGLGATTVGADSLDHVQFDPSAATVGQPNYITYKYTDANSCTASYTQGILINAVTNVNFHMVAPAVLKGSVIELCPHSGNVELIGEPPPSTGLFGSTYTKFIIQDSLGVTLLPQYIASVAGRWYILTDLMPSNLYLITYQFENTSAAKSDHQRYLRIFARPTAKIGVASTCVKDSVHFSNQSTLAFSAFSSMPVIANNHWFFDDGNESTVLSPSHKYGAPGTFNVKLIVTSNESYGCQDTARVVIKVGDYPFPDFKWKSICTNDSTNFTDLTAAEFPLSNIVKYSWDFGDTTSVSGPGNMNVNDPINRVSGMIMNPKHNFKYNLTYKVVLKVDTDDGCSNIGQKDVFILKQSTVRIGASGKLEDFESSDGGWKAENLAPNNPSFNDSTSWQWGPLTGSTINSASTGSRAWWTGAQQNTVRNTKYYYTNEASAINGPCYDLSALNRPMISLDYWSDTQQDFDGAVLQYSIDGGDNWKDVGLAGGGINWYGSSRFIIGNPGLQTGADGGIGWTGQTKRWLNGRYNLDQVPDSTAANPITPNPRKQVRVRIAFGSDGSNSATTTQFNGFAVDNVLVGDKQRNVLIEHFTNSKAVPASPAADNYLNGLYQLEADWYHGIADFTAVQYHIIDNGRFDPLTRDNLVDPADRLEFFGGGNAPTTVVDGLKNSVFTGYYTEITDQTVDKRALKDPQFTLKMIPSLGNKPGTLSAKVVITADTISFNGSLRVQAVLIEDTVVVNSIKYTNVVRKFLFPESISVFPETIAKGDSTIKVVSNVLVNVPIVDPSKLRIVAFVQNNNTKEVYQSIVMRCPPGFVPSVISGLDTPVDNIQLFPNPAVGTVMITVPNDFPASNVWTILDSRGVSVREGDFNGTIDGKKTVDISGLASGVYFVNMGSQKNQMIHRKLIVLSGN